LVIGAIARTMRSLTDRLSQERTMPISNDFFSRRPALLGLAAATLVGLAACGGSSSDDSSNPGGNPPPPVTTGKVTILLTDAPTDAFCQVLATVERIDLFGGSGTPTNVFTGPATVDVLALRNYSDVLAIAPAVPVGTYSKVRMTLSDLALVECDGAGNPEPESGWEHPKLPGNGKLDLNPRGSFQVAGGETLVIELDLDMEKSLHLHQTGNGRWQFRPVIFVTIRPDDTRLVRVYGEARDLDGTTFELCPVEPVSSMHRGPGPAGSECLDVFTDGSTGLFDETGSPVGLGAVANGDLLTAIGFLGLHDDDDGDSRMHDLRLDAVVVELGELGTFERLQGRVVSAPGNNDLFVFDPTPVDAAANAIDVRLQSGTRIFAIGGDEELTSAALQPGTTGEVDGVFTDPATDGEPLKSSLIVLDQDTTPAVVLTGARIKTIPADDDAVPATRRLTVDTAALTGKCVRTDADTRYLRITESANASETVEIAFADLAVGDQVDVYGSDDPVDTACVMADTIQKFVTAP
jgi:hypothetical protein